MTAIYLDVGAWVLVVLVLVVWVWGFVFLEVTLGVEHNVYIARYVVAAIYVAMDIDIGISKTRFAC